MAESVVLQTTREWRNNLTQLENRQTRSMVQRWLRIERNLDAQIIQLTQEIYEMRQQGVEPTLGRLYRLARFQELQEQIRQELRAYENFAEDLISADKVQYVELGVETAVQQIHASHAPGVTPSFVRLPAEATEVMAARTSDGAPLFDVLKKRALTPYAIGGLIDGLMTGMALGWNPRKTAQQMKNGLGGGLQKALVIARTEQLGANRHAALEQYRLAGRSIVYGYRRLAAHDPRTCLACLVLDGKFYSVGEEMGDHPQGRCVPVPSVKGLGEVEWETGTDWLMHQDEDVQRRVMGNKRFEDWKTSYRDLADYVYMKEDPTWGEAPAIRPLWQIDPSKFAEPKKGEPEHRFSGRVVFEAPGVSESTVGRMLTSGDIYINLEKVRGMSPEERRAVLAHEIAHGTAEDILLREMSEWEKAQEALTIEMNERAPAGRIFAGGETRLNESMVEVMAVALTSNSPSGSITAEHLKWAAEALKHLGFNPSKLREDIDRLDLDVFERLKALALEAEPTVTPQGLKWLGSSKQMAEWERLGMLRFEGSLIEDFGYEKDAARKAALDAVERMKATWEERRDGLHLAARSPIDAAISILKDGRFKSQFEVRRSQGALSPHTRREAELRGLGIPEDVTDDQRPIYGYVETLNAGQEKVGVSQYGPIKWVLKDHVKDRTTITWGDSLYSMKQGDSGSIPYNGEFSAAAMASTEFPPVEGHLTSACYIEAQMQGQVWIEDVAEVRIVNPRLRLYGRRAVAFGLDDELEELERKSVWENGLTRGEKWTELKHLIRLLDEAGIPWSVEGEQEWEAQEW